MCVLILALGKTYSFFPQNSLCKFYSLASNIPNICLLYCVIILYSDEQSEGEYN